MATIDEIKQQAEAVKNASHVGENTALRVGGVLVDLCECMKNLSGGGTSGGSGVSLGTLLTKLNTENPFPTNNGQVLTYDGSNFVWKAPTGSGGTSGGGSGGSLKPLEVVGKDSSTFFVYNGETRYRLRFGSGLSMKLNVDEYVVTADGSNGGSGVALSAVMSAMNDQLGKTSYGTPQFLYWNGSTYTWKNESEISGGSGSSSRIKKIKLFTNNSDSSFETVELGTADTIGFMAGDNVSLQAVVKEYTNVIKISANVSSSGGSSGSVDLSNYLTKTEASSTYAVKNHTHSAAAITGFEDAVTLVKVNNANAADRLANAVTLWGNNFSGNNSIGTASSRADLKYVKDIYAGDTFDIKAGNNSVLKVDGTPNIYVGFGYMANAKASLLLFGNKTTICTSGDDYRYNFKGGVFDVNTNTIHFGPEASGGKISWDRTNNAVKIEGNVYATGGITALGVSNSATTSNNLDFTFKSVTADTFNVKNSIQISDSLELSRDGEDVYLSSSNTNTSHFIYLDGTDRKYYLNSYGGAYFNSLTCDSALSFSGVTNFDIVEITNNGFCIQFEYNGKTYRFIPSEGSVTVS